MYNILQTLFLDNPYIPEQICQFCDQIPEFKEAEHAYEACAAKLRARLGSAEYEDFEETFNWHLAQYSKAYYLFGLGLRQEVLSALSQAG